MELIIYEIWRDENNVYFDLSGRGVKREDLRPLSEIAGSNPAGGMDVCLLCLLCVVR
jgi:hypothetical protein